MSIQCLALSLQRPSTTNAAPSVRATVPPTASRSRPPRVSPSGNTRSERTDPSRFATASLSPVTSGSFIASPDAFLNGSTPMTDECADTGVAHGCSHRRPPTTTAARIPTPIAARRRTNHGRRGIGSSSVVVTASTRPRRAAWIATLRARAV
jgi:hypothetical protein